MKRYELIAFDLDGTLTEPSEGLVASFAYALDRMAVDYGTRESLVRYIGPPLYTRWRQDYGFSVEEADRALAYFHDYYASRGWRENRVYDGIPALLERLRARGYRIALATSKPEHFARDILDLFHLTPYFDRIVGAVDEKVREKKSEVLDFVLSSFPELARERCILVGDRVYDAEGAALCGIDSLGVLYGHGSRAEVDAAGFTYVAETVEDILAFFP